MKYAQKSDIRQLIESPADSKAISIFIPTHRISLPHNLKADRVRMKNAIRDIVAHLERAATSAEDIKRYVKKLHEIHADFDFWKYRDNGLAIYAKKDAAVHYDLPIEIEPSAHIGEHFIISPLLAASQDNYRYYLLELNLDEPRFFVASQSGMERILTEEMPGNLETTLRIDEYQENLQHASSSGAPRDATHHGHGGSSDMKWKDTDKYYRIVDRVLHDNILKNSNLPLIIAADGAAADHFRKISNYRHFAGRVVEGNYQRASEDELRDLSWGIMCEEIERQENLFGRLFEKARYRDNRQALINGEHIRKAARQGRVATLTISIVHRTYDSVVRRMEQRFKIALPSSKRQLRNIEQTTRAVLRTGGDVTALLYNEQTGNNEQYIKAITR